MGTGAAVDRREPSPRSRGICKSPVAVAKGGGLGQPPTGRAPTRQLFAPITPSIRPRAGEPVCLVPPSPEARDGGHPAFLTSRLCRPSRGPIPRTSTWAVEPGRDGSITSILYRPFAPRALLRKAAGRESTSGSPANKAEDSRRSRSSTSRRHAGTSLDKLVTGGERQARDDGHPARSGDSRPSPHTYVSPPVD